MSNYLPLSKIQQSFITYAQVHHTALIEVLRNSASPDHRAIAVKVLAYSTDKAGIVGYLSHAVLDPHKGVRNNATRPLGVLAQFGNDNPELGIQIPAQPFVEMLNSIVWTDRNKALLVLNPLTEGRDSDLMQILREKSLISLIEMCKWDHQGHAGMACRILLRMVGLPEDQFSEPWDLIISRSMELME